MGRGRSGGVGVSERGGGGGGGVAYFVDDEEIGLGGEEILVKLGKVTKVLLTCEIPGPPFRGTLSPPATSIWETQTIG